jgi:hypothetical protein
LVILSRKDRKVNNAEIAEFSSRALWLSTSKISDS